MQTEMAEGDVFETPRAPSVCCTAMPSRARRARMIAAPRSRRFLRGFGCGSIG
jgi:hypothetical protein